MKLRTVASLELRLTFARGAIEWEMVDIIVAKKDVKSSNGC